MRRTQRERIKEKTRNIVLERTRQGLYRSTEVRAAQGVDIDAVTGKDHTTIEKMTDSSR